MAEHCERTAGSVRHAVSDAQGRVNDRAPSASGRWAGTRVRPALPGVAGGIHGLCRRRLRRLRGARAHPQGKAMKRVCVDGPVFPAAAVYPA